MADDGVATGPSNNAGLRIFRSLATGLRGIARAQAAADLGGFAPSSFDPHDLVTRIVVVLASPAAFHKFVDSLFNKYSTASTDDHRERMLPLEQFPQILAHLHIPEEHLPLFWALLRQRLGWETRVLPHAVNLEAFSVVLLKALRRLRDRYSLHRVTPDQFVAKNQRRLDEEYAIGESCGKGSFGTCFWITHKQSKKKRVCKRIPMEEVQVPTEEMPQELDALRRLDHPNILRVYEWFEAEDAYELVLDAARGGDLRHLLKNSPERNGSHCLDEKLVRTIVTQSLHALVYIHSSNVIHRDVKPANMLLASADLEDPRLLLADFGVAELCDGPMRAHATVKGTVAYMAPEVFQAEVSPRTDCWALGVVAFELLSGVRPFHAENPMSMYAQLKKTEVQFGPVEKQDVGQVALSFLRCLLVKDEAARASATEALAHEWVAEHAHMERRSSSKVSGRHARKARSSILAYVNSSHFSKTALMCVATQLDTASLERIAQVFESFDKDHDGLLTTSEFIGGLQAIGVDQESIEHLADGLDVNCNGSIEYSEFIAALLHTQGDLIEDVLHHAFRIFDFNGDGKISLEELEVMLNGSSAPLHAILPDGKTPAQVLAEIDTDCDGAISLAEFKAYLHKDWRAHEQANKATAERVQHINNPSESLEALFKTLAAQLGKSEEELACIADHLAKRHWLRTVGDLQELHESDWVRLDLPLKLEILLRSGSGVSAHANRFAFQPAARSLSVPQTSSQVVGKLAMPKLWNAGTSTTALSNPTTSASVPDCSSGVAEGINAGQSRGASSRVDKTPTNGGMPSSDFRQGPQLQIKTSGLQMPAVVMGPGTPGLVSPKPGAAKVISSTKMSPSPSVFAHIAATKVSADNSGTAAAAVAAPPGSQLFQSSSFGGSLIPPPPHLQQQVHSYGVSPLRGGDALAARASEPIARIAPLGPSLVVGERPAHMN